jgi:hypothetical protein
LKDSFNAWLHKGFPEWKDMPIHEIQPVKFGGDPFDLLNKVVLTPILHNSSLTRFWNAVQRSVENPTRGWPKGPTWK